MFIGHFGFALAAKRLAPRTSLGTLVGAAQLLDLVWPLFVLLGIEEVRVAPGDTAFTPLEFVRYPWTHSLLMVVMWSLAFALVYRARGGGSRGAWVLGGLVLSHWVLDFVAHRPDLPLAPGAARVGLGLWNSVPATVIIEGAIFAIGVYVYVSTMPARGRAGRVGFWGLVVFLAGIYVANMTAPPPPSARAVGLAGLLTWLFIPWAAWVDRQRGPVRGGDHSHPGSSALNASGSTGHRAPTSTATS
jgi:hypothetical protein